MSAPTRDPLVVNTQDGACWVRRAVTREGRGLYAVADAPKCCPEFVMATLAELAEHGLASMADALPMPVGAERSPLDQAHDDLAGANLNLWEEEQDNARLRLALKSAKRRALRRLPHEREGLIFRLEQDNKQLHAFVEIANEAARVQCEAWEGAQDELERLRARVAELEAAVLLLNTLRGDVALLVERERGLGEECVDIDDVEAALVLGSDEVVEAEGITRLFAPTQALREDDDPGRCLEAHVFSPRDGWRMVCGSCDHGKDAECHCAKTGGAS